MHACMHVCVSQAHIHTNMPTCGTYSYTLIYVTHRHTYVNLCVYANNDTTNDYDYCYYTVSLVIAIASTIIIIVYTARPKRTYRPWLC